MNRPCVRDRDRDAHTQREINIIIEIGRDRNTHTHIDIIVEGERNAHTHTHKQSSNENQQPCAMITNEVRIRSGIGVSQRHDRRHGASTVALAEPIAAHEHDAVVVDECA